VGQAYVHLPRGKGDKVGTSARLAQGDSGDLGRCCYQYCFRELQQSDVLVLQAVPAKPALNRSENRREPL